LGGQNNNKEHIMAFNYSPKVVTEGLVLYLDAANTKSYPSSGTTWSDLSRTGVNGTLINGPTFNSGNGGSIVFDGVNDYVDCGNIFNFERTDSFSINAWVNITSLSLFRIIIAKMDISFRGYAFIVDPNGELVFILRNTPTTNSLLVRTNINLVSTNNWFNITVTYSGNSLPSGVNFYINSTPHPVATIVNNTLTQTIISSASLAIGRRASNDSFILGRIAQTTIYNRALTAQEVLQNYNATKSRFGL